ncbi:MAG: uncharacterized protein PWP03_833 [Candidatus Woesearchaeota archaeon]|nr:uncharacterized protein [Candidatus Woesearchaeota archaeon]MDN5328195.1 uncharacterized protein [Candidatus Woesearchaeota archaeon]
MMISIDVEYLYVAPAIRKYVAQKLLERGFKQKEVAKIMGFTPSAINQYLKNKRASKVLFNKKEKSIIDERIDKLINGEISLQLLVKQVIDIFEKEGAVCRIHKCIEPIKESCIKLGFKNPNEKV